MKQFSRTYLPDEMKYNGETYKAAAGITSAMIANNTSLKIIENTLKKEGRKMVVVNVLSKNLKGKTDLHGKPYQPQKHIYTT
jgi:hypothetical protein